MGHAEAAPTTTEFDPLGESALTVFGGRMLPYGIYGVRDIYPEWGAHYAFKLGEFIPEFSASFVNSQEVNFYTGSASLLFPSQIADFTLLAGVGLDSHYYRGHTNIRILPYSADMGAHLSASPVIHIAGDFSLRVDFEMAFNPGMILFVNGGLMYRF